MKLFRLTGVALIILLPTAARSQEIPVKSIPVATGTQFLLFPSENAALGSVNIALRDVWHDALINPASGASISGTVFAVTPHYYKIGQTLVGESSSARSLPLSILLRRGSWFGGASLALQEMSKRNNVACCTFFDESSLTSLPTEKSALSSSNLYSFAMVGRDIPHTRLSVGLSVFTGMLNGLEGVRLLYAQGSDVEQKGRIANVRLGLAQNWTDGRRAEVAISHHRFNMNHTMTEWISNNDSWNVSERRRLEQDQTQSWAVRAGYEHPIGGGWRLGGRLVGDWKSHPKIPNYDLMQIPRDPGNSEAYNLGVGAARTIERSTYALDIVFEPIWSHTWADAIEDIKVRDSDRLIPKGAMTVENFFRFRNAHIRMGVRQRGKRLEIGAGLNLRLYSYRLRQENFVERFKRTLDQSWSEWTITSGAGYSFDTFTVRYLIIMTWGTGQPGLAQSRAQMSDGSGFASSFVVAPAGPLDVDRARVWTHRISLLLPL